MSAWEMVEQIFGTFNQKVGWWAVLVPVTPMFIWQVVKRLPTRKKTKKTYRSSETRIFKTKKK